MSKYQIIQGDVRAMLKTVESESVQTCVTSPPYFGLRDYGVDGQIGLEQTPEAFVAELVDVFREVRRVLRNDGTLWLNLGDSYSAGGRGGGAEGSIQSKNIGSTTGTVFDVWKVPGFKPKNLLGIPWRVAFALQADGWYLRQDIIWHKPNPMPESVKDRCTKAHEYIFLLSKSQKYFFDNDSIREPVKISADLALDSTPIEMNEKDKARHAMAKNIWGGNQMSKPRGAMYRGYSEVKGANKRSVWTVNVKGYKEAHFATFPEDLITPCILAGSREGDLVLDPFNGSGTTGVVSLKHGRRYLGVELNSEYVEIAHRRIANSIPPMMMLGEGM